MNPYEAPRAEPVARPAVKPSFAAHDLRVRRLFAAITRGEGYASPRTVGAAYAGIGVAMGGLNLALLVASGRFLVWFMAICPTFILCGAVLLITGEPLDRGYPAPLWSRWLLGLAFAGGILLGVASSIAVGI